MPGREESEVDISPPHSESGLAEGEGSPVSLMESEVDQAWRGPGIGGTGKTSHASSGIGLEERVDQLRLATGKSESDREARTEKAFDRLPDCVIEQYYFLSLTFKR